MTWTTPVPSAIAAFRDMLVACPSAASFGLVQARFHYPKATMHGSGAQPRPLAELDETGAITTKYAEQGVAGNPSGTLVCTIHAESTVSTLENLARTIRDELLTQSTGLPLRGVDAGRCSDPTSAARAADETTADSVASFSSITLTVEWGLSA